MHLRDLVLLVIHLVVTLARSFRPGGVRSMFAESLLVKHQLLILNRSGKRAPSTTLQEGCRCAILRCLRPAKLAALLGREVPRDVYDLDLLIPASSPPTPEQVHWAVERAQLRYDDAKQILSDRLRAMTWSRFQTELFDALPDHISTRFDEVEWESLKQRVGVYAKSLLNEAAQT